MVYYICKINLQEERGNSDNVQDIFIDQREIGYDVDTKHFMAIYGPLENFIFDVFKTASHYGSLTHQHHVHVTEAEGGMQIKRAVSYRGKTVMSEQSRFITTASRYTTLRLT